MKILPNMDAVSMVPRPLQSLPGETAWFCSLTAPLCCGWAEGCVGGSGESREGLMWGRFGVGS